MTCCPVIITQKEEWTKYTDQSFDYCIYHTWYYHSLDKRGSPLLFVYKEVDTFIAIPLIKREIADSKMFDFTSVYGYSGPISNKQFNEIDSQIILNFELSFKDFVKNEQSISVFSRLHPFFNQLLLLNKMGGIKSNGKTIYMDLTMTLEQQRENYNKRLLRQVKQLRKKEYVIKEANTINEVRIFTNMYKENMDRLSATDDYYFDETYFANMLLSKELKCKLILIYSGTEAICGAIIAFSNSIIRNHLSATNYNYIKESPSKLLTDEISIIGRKMGLKYFHLGGGVGGKEDSLFTFKSYFSNLFIEDYIWCYVSDDHAYQTLVNDKNIIPNSNFFPLYRSSVIA